MYALVINCGSSSLKFALIAAEDNETVVNGAAERLGSPEAQITIKHDSDIQKNLDDPTHLGAVTEIFAFLKAHHLAEKIDAVGHRVVHGAEFFSESVQITPEVIEIIERCAPVAPIHNPANLVGILAAMEVLPHLPHVAVFDTAFHQTMPPKAFLYGLPLELYHEHNIRRYGFHGSSHRYIAEKTAEILHIPKDEINLISAHLGNGASIAAIKGGKSVDTSMGLTPLEGVMMGTRSGSIDPGLVPYLTERLGYNVEEIDILLNEKSGLLGVSGVSNDCRTLEAKAKEGHEPSRLALDIFAYRIAKKIASYLPALQRTDAIVFTGGIGENSTYIREVVINYLSFLGFTLNKFSNRACVAGVEGAVGSSPHFGEALVVCTDEEGMIVRDTLEVVRRNATSNSATTHN